jgi:CMP-N-acetylneuraminate monooxygenase
MCEFSIFFRAICSTQVRAKSAGTGRHELIPSAADRIARAFEEQQSAQVVSPALDPRVTRDRLMTHLLRLNETSEIAHSENLTGSFDVCKGDYSEDLFNVSFAIEEGRLRISETVGSPNLAIRIPLEAVSQIIDHDLSWDEAFIGYWCRFDRDPDVYHAGFWRLMQSPSASRKVSLPKYNGGAIGPHSVIAEILEDFGDEADRILKRYGLYCLGCQHSTQETVANAALQHGLEQQKVEILVRELARTFDPR